MSAASLILEDSMARISLIAPEAASPEVREIYDTTLRGKPAMCKRHLPIALRCLRISQLLRQCRALP